MKYLALVAAGILLLTPCSLECWTAGVNAGTKAASIGQREQYQKQVEKKLRDLDREIAELKAQVSRQGRDLRKQFAQRMAELDGKRKAAQRELAQFEHTSEQAWQDAKPDLDAAINDLETAYERAAADFKQKGRSE